MLAVVLTLLLLPVPAGEFQASRPTPLVPVFEPRYSYRDGILDLRDGEGWLRTERLFLNFRVGFDFKATTPDADPGVFVRAWLSPGGHWPTSGYRVRLPTSPAPFSALVTGHERRVTILQEGQLVFRSPNEWQQVEITGEGARVSVTLNGILAGTFAVEDFGGYVMFDSRHGRVQFRNIRVFSTEREPEIPADLLNSEQLTKIGGKAPRLLYELRPEYLGTAMRDKVQGVMTMHVVVLSDGSVGPVRVTRSLHRDLDLAAIAAVRAWKFAPATLHDQPVAILVEVEMTFKLN